MGMRAPLECRTRWEWRSLEVWCGGRPKNMCTTDDAVVSLRAAPSCFQVSCWPIAMPDC